MMRSAIGDCFRIPSQACPHRVHSQDHHETNHVALSLALAACGRNDGATGPIVAGVRIVEGAAATDSIDAPIAPLTVVLRDSAGQLPRGIEVQFSVDTTRRTRFLLSDDPNEFLPLGFTLTQVTDNSRLARVYRRAFGPAGTALLSITVPAIHASVSDSSVIRPGAPVRMRVPADTAVYIGGAGADLNAYIVDRQGSRLPNAVAYTTADTLLSVSNGLVSGRAFGEGRVAASSGALSATFHVSIVPRGTIAVQSFTANHGVALFDLDLSHYRIVAPALKNAWCNGCALPLVQPTWQTDGQRIFFVGGYTDGEFGETNGVSTTELSGDWRRLFSMPTLQLTTDPSYSKYGPWLYFAGKRTFDSNYSLFRSKPDGSEVSPLPPANPAEREVERHPEVSPDGTLLAYAYGFLRPRVRVRSLATGLRLPLDVEGTSPEWSPDGSLIAFVVTENFDGYYGELHVVKPDGSGERRVAAGGYRSTFSWSPDGKYIIAYATEGLSLIEVGSGRVVKLVSGIPYLAPAWRPIQ